MITPADKKYDHLEQTGWGGGRWFPSLEKALGIFWIGRLDREVDVWMIMDGR